MAGDEAAVMARGLTKRYGGGATALHGVDLTVGRGELVGFLGRSGAGKTTLFRLLNGALRPTAGELVVLGMPLARLQGTMLRSLRCRVAVVPQFHGLIPALTAGQNVLLGTLGRRGTLAAMRSLVYLTPAERALAWGALERVGLGDHLYARADRLSGGQQQRVAVARALVQRPELLLADEPVASVDGETAATLLDLFGELAAGGCTVLVSLHQPGLALRYCPRVVSLADGRVAYDGPTTELPAAAPVERSPVADGHH